MNEDDFSESANIRPNWVVVGETTNRIIAEFAVNGLKSYEIPAVLDSRPGVFGTSGLPLRSLRTGKLDKFKILVPSEYEEEARDLINQFLGDENNATDDVENEED